jgi:hypothetical protein
MFTKQPLYDRHYGLILVTLIVQWFEITTFHLFPIRAMCSPYWNVSISWNDAVLVS